MAKVSIGLSFDYPSLPRDYPRKYLPASIEWTDTVQLKQLFDQLEQKPARSRVELEKWLEHESELLAAVNEEQALRYILMTCQTDDPAREKAHLDFIEKVEPEVKIRSFQLDKKYLSSPARKELDQTRFSVMDRRKENSVSIFREENVELEKEDSKIGQNYQKVTGAWTVLYDGQERTVQQMAKFLDEPDRSVREKTWLLAEERRFKDRDELNRIYDELLALRGKIAKNAGFDNFMDFMFRRLNRFDYKPEDCVRFHEAVEKHIVPLVRELDAERKRKLGVNILRPWDMAVDPDNQPPLKPFKDSKELVEKSATVFSKVDPELGKDFRRMAGLKLLDLDSRKGKAPGGYSYDLAEVQFPFIFMNSVGREGDMRTMLHESGHAFQAFETRNHNLLYQLRGGNVPIEFSEVASQAMELIGGEHLEGVFYNHADYVRSRREHLIGEVKLLPWVATIDAFQHWIYTHPEHSVGEREDYWSRLKGRFGGGDDWKGYEQYWRSRWQRQLHLYLVPFYYIEYGISLLGALGVWYNYRKDPAKAVKAYRTALGLGGSVPLPKLFQTAGVPFDFGPKTIEPYGRELRSILVPK
jgi:oligoendopeptidase F